MEGADFEFHRRRDPRRRRGERTLTIRSAFLGAYLLWSLSFILISAVRRLPTSETVVQQCPGEDPSNAGWWRGVCDVITLQWGVNGSSSTRCGALRPRPHGCDSCAAPTAPANPVNTGNQLFIELLAGIGAYCAVLVALFRIEGFLRGDRGGAEGDVALHHHLLGVRQNGHHFFHDQHRRHPGVFVAPDRANGAFGLRHSDAKTCLELVEKLRAKPRNSVQASRRPVETGERCPVCFETLTLGTAGGSGVEEGCEDEGSAGGGSALRWPVAHCPWGCGKAVHVHCMARWVEACDMAGKVAPTCVFCKAPWI